MNFILKIFNAIKRYSRHYTFLLFYLGSIIFITINLAGPLFFVRKLGFFKKTTTKIIWFFLMRLQLAIATMLVTVGGTTLTIFQPKNKKLDDPRNLHKHSAVTISNHLCELDSLYIGAVLTKLLPRDNHIRVFAKAPIRFYPFIGWSLSINDSLFVINNKSTGEKIDQKNYVKSMLNCDHIDKSNVLIFIEGTTKWKEEKERREKLAHKWGAPTYKNLLIPKPTGLNLIESIPEIDKEYYLTMKFNDGGNMYHTLGTLLKGHMPKSVDIFIEGKEIDKSLVNNPDNKKFNNNVYNNWKDVDDRLSMQRDEWLNKYDHEIIGWSYDGIASSIILIVLTLCMGWLFFTNILYLTYFICASSTFHFIAKQSDRQMKKLISV